MSEFDVLIDSVMAPVESLLTGRQYARLTVAVIAYIRTPDNTFGPGAKAWQESADNLLEIMKKTPLLTRQLRRELCTRAVTAHNDYRNPTRSQP